MIEAPTPRPSHAYISDEHLHSAGIDLIQLEKSIITEDLLIQIFTKLGQAKTLSINSFLNVTKILLNGYRPLSLNSVHFALEVTMRLAVTHRFKGEERIADLYKENFEFYGYNLFRDIIAKVMVSYSQGKSLTDYTNCFRVGGTVLTLISGRGPIMIAADLVEYEMRLVEKPKALDDFECVLTEDRLNSDMLDKWFCIFCRLDARRIENVKSRFIEAINKSLKKPSFYDVKEEDDESAIYKLVVGSSIQGLNWVQAVKKVTLILGCPDNSLELMRFFLSLVPFKVPGARQSLLSRKKGKVPGSLLRCPLDVSDITEQRSKDVVESFRVQFQFTGILGAPYYIALLSSLPFTHGLSKWGKDIDWIDQAKLYIQDLVRLEADDEFIEIQIDKFCELFLHKRKYKMIVPFIRRQLFAAWGDAIINKREKIVVYLRALDSPRFYVNFFKFMEMIKTEKSSSHLNDQFLFIKKVNRFYDCPVLMKQWTKGLGKDEFISSKSIKKASYILDYMEVKEREFGQSLSDLAIELLPTKSLIKPLVALMMAIHKNYPNALVFIRSWLEKFYEQVEEFRVMRMADQESILYLTYECFPHFDFLERAKKLLTNHMTMSDDSIYTLTTDQEALIHRIVSPIETFKFYCLISDKTSDLAHVESEYYVSWVYTLNGQLHNLQNLFSITKTKLRKIHQDFIHQRVLTANLNYLDAKTAVLNAMIYCYNHIQDPALQMKVVDIVIKSKSIMISHSPFETFIDVNDKNQFYIRDHYEIILTSATEFDLIGLLRHFEP
jgi:hypothetical protein